MYTIVHAPRTKDHVLISWPKKSTRELFSMYTATVFLFVQSTFVYYIYVHAYGYADEASCWSLEPKDRRETTRSWSSPICMWPPVAHTCSSSSALQMVAFAEDVPQECFGFCCLSFDPY